jgi:type VI secretion system secreted protein VgrG
MPASLVQEERLLQVDTPLGPNELVLRSLQGREAVSELFEVQLDLASENFQIEAASLIAKPISVTILLDEEKKRFINGYVKQFSLLPSADRHAHYRASVVPWLWFLTRVTDCAIYQEKSVPEIVEEVFKKYGFTDFDDKLKNKYAKRDYCVQYRESVFQFVSRLLEEEGISYYFEHEETKHTLILADDPGAHPKGALEPEVRWEPGTGSGFSRTESYIHGWVRRVNVRSTQWAQADFNFEKPRFNLSSTVPGLSSLPVPKLELYDYPGRFDSLDRGEGLTKTRMEEEECAIDTVQGRSGCRGFMPGFAFEVKDHFRADQNGEYLLTALEYEAEQGSLFAGDVGKPERYENRFTAIPMAIPLRPLRLTPKPYIRGPQTAFVTGPSGEEIYVDEYGRVKVQFHWDRQGQMDAKTSCWIRVSQSIAGKGWGSVQLPRVGQEVIVEFLEGDPDQPLITGRVYNAEQTLPYALPAEKTKTTLKTLTYPHGGGFNELRFEDKKDSEQVFIFGQKDFDLRVQNIVREYVGKDRHEITDQDVFEKIARDHHNDSGRDWIHTIGRDEHSSVGGKAAYSVADSYSLKTGAAAGYQYGGDVAISVSGNLSINATGQIVLSAGSGLTIKVGGNHVTIDPSGVTIVGTMTKINSGGAALSPSSPNLVTPLKAGKALLADTAIPGQESFNTQIGAMTPAQKLNLAALSAPTHNPSSNGANSNSNSDQDKKKTAWVEVELADENGKPAAGASYRVELPDGSVASGSLDEKGFARVEGIDPGSVKVTFPDYDQDAWEPN